MDSLFSGRAVIRNAILSFSDGEMDSQPSPLPDVVRKCWCGVSTNTITMCDRCLRIRLPDEFFTCYRPPSFDDDAFSLLTEVHGLEGTGFPNVIARANFEHELIDRFGDKIFFAVKYFDMCMVHVIHTISPGIQACFRILYVFTTGGIVSLIGEHAFITDIPQRMLANPIEDEIIEAAYINASSDWAKFYEPTYDMQSGSYTSPNRNLCVNDRSKRRSLSPDPASMAPIPSPPRPVKVLSPHAKKKQDKSREHWRKYLRDSKHRSHYLPQAGFGLGDFFSHKISLSNETAQLISNLTEKLPTRDDASDVVDHLTASLKGVGDHLTMKVGTILSLAISGYAMIKSEDKKYRYIFGGIFVTSGLWLACRESEYLQRVMDSAFPSGNTTQIGSDSIDAVSTLLLAYLHFEVAKKMPPQKKVAQFIAGTATWSRAQSGISSLMAFSISMVERIINFVRRDILGYDSLQVLQTELPEVDRWTAKVLELLDQHKDGRLEVNSITADKLHSVLKEGYVLISKEYPGGHEHFIRSTLSTYIGIMRKIYGPYEMTHYVDAGPRMEPLAILLRGESGVGKTAATLPFIKMVTSYVLPEEHLEDFRRRFADYIYMRKPENEYWERYFGQFCCVFDDYAQIKDVAGNPDCEFMDTIRCINMFPNTLHMADLASKGSTMFRSKLVFGTTNLKHIVAESINQSEAVTRRWDVVYDVYPKKEYCTAATREGANQSRRLDVNHPKLRSGNFIPDIYEFHLVTWNGELIQIQDWDDAIQHCVSGFRKKEARLDNYLGDLDEIADGVIAKRLSKYRDDLKVQAGGWKGKDKSHIDLVDLDELNLSDDIIHPFEERLAVTIDLRWKTFGIRPPYTPRQLMNFLSKEFPDVWNSSKSGDLGYEFYEKLWLCDMVLSGAMSKDVMYVTKDERGAMERCREKILSIYNDAKSTLLSSKGWKILVGTLSAIMTLKLSMSVIEMLFPGKLDSILPWRDYKPFTYGPNDIRSYKSLSTVSDSIVGANMAGPYADVTPWKASRLVHGESEKKLDGVPLARNNDMVVGYMPESNHYTLSPERFVKRIESMIASGTWDTSLKCTKQEAEELISHISNLSNIDAQNCIENFIDFIGSRNQPVKLTVRELFKEARHTGADFTIESNYPMRGRGKQQRPQRTIAHTQAVDKNACEQMDKVLKKNMFIIRLEGREPFGYVTFVKGNVALMPLHFMQIMEAKMKEGDSVTKESPVLLENPLTGVKHLVKVGDFNIKRSNEMSQRDLCLVQFPSVAQKPDITKYFITEAIAINWWDAYCALIAFDRAGSKIERHFYVNPSIANWVKTGLGEHGAMYNDKVFMYRANTRNGDCGALLQIQNASIGPGKIIGVHTAGDETSGNGISPLVTYELLEDAIDSLFSGVCPPPEEVKMVPQLIDLPFQGNFQPFFKLDKKVSQPTESKIIKSKLYGKISDSVKAPARLGPYVVDGVVRNPKHDAIVGYGIIANSVPNDLCQLAMDGLKRRWLNDKGSSDYRGRVLTFDAAILGEISHPYKASIARSTSAGFPYVMENFPGYKGKEYYLGKGQEFDLSNERALHLRSMVLEMEDKAKRGERHYNVYVDTCKDELRSLDRVALGKTRLVSAAPFPYVILCRMYFLDFCSAMMSRKTAWASGVGVNPFSDDWHFMAKLMLSNGNKFIAGDYSGFDKRHVMTICLMICNAINEWYDDGLVNARVRYVLFMDLVNSIHVCDDVVYGWLRSLPSGHPLTTILNTIYNIICINVVYIKLFVEQGLGTLNDAVKSFWDNVCPVAYGDDLVASISDRVISWYNQNTITSTMCCMDQIYTDESKIIGAVVQPYKSIEEITFLKRSFRYEKSIGKWIAPLDMGTILEMLNWTKKCASSDLITKGNIDIAMRELALHPEEDFHHWGALVVRASQVFLHYTPELTRYQSLLMEALKLEYYF